MSEIDWNAKLMSLITKTASYCNRAINGPLPNTGKNMLAVVTAADGCFTRYTAGERTQQLSDDIDELPTY